MEFDLHPFRSESEKNIPYFCGWVPEKTYIIAYHILRMCYLQFVLFRRWQHLCNTNVLRGRSAARMSQMEHSEFRGAELSGTAKPV
jgi:hypothetical protein